MGKIGDLWVRLGLKSDDYKKGMKDAQKETSSFSNSLGKMKAGALAVWAAVGAGVLSFAKQIKNATNRAGDAWEMFIAKSNAGWKTFIQSLSAFNWDNFIGRFKEARAAAEELQSALDASFEISNSIKLQKAAMAEELASLEILARNVSKPYEERAKAAQKYLDMVKPIYDQELALANRLLDAQQGRWLAGTGLQDNAQTRADLERFLVEYGKNANLANALATMVDATSKTWTGSSKLAKAQLNGDKQYVAQYRAASQYVADYQQTSGYKTDIFALAKAYETMRGDEDTKPLVDALIAAGEARAAFDKETKRMQQALNASLGQTDITGTLADDLTAGLMDVYAQIDAIDFSDIDIEMPKIDMSEFDKAEARAKQYVENQQRINDEIAQQNQMLANTIADSLSGATQAFTDMLFGLEGADASNILAALLQPFAQTAGQLGTMLITQGLAIDAFKKSLQSLQGGVAIAAGAALLAVSAAMKSGIQALAGGAKATTATTYSGNESAGSMGFDTYDSTITVEVVGKLRGSDILLAGSSQQKKWNR